MTTSIHDSQCCVELQYSALTCIHIFSPVAMETCMAAAYKEIYKQDA